MTIAIIDDLLKFVEGVKKEIFTLQPDWQVQPYENGKHFIDTYLQQELPTLILLDIRMPIMDGYDTAIWLHANLPTVPVLIFTDICNQDAFMYIGKLGVKGALGKSTPTIELISAIETVVDGGYFFNTGTQYSLRNNKMYMGNKEITKGLCILTKHEVQIFKLMCSNLSLQEIADKAGISKRTYDNIRSSIYKKLELNTREGVIFYGISVGVVPIQ
jgi:two-component system, NarL family, invasion response regulator UvrY